MKTILTALILIMLAGCGQFKGDKGEPGAPGATGNTGSTGAQGQQGLQGSAGTPGANGTNGQSCSVVTIDPNDLTPYGGALITCPDSSVIVSNGVPGPQGEPGPQSLYSMTTIINPCGDAPGIYDEVFFKLQDRTVVASFSDNAAGKNTRFSLLTAGTYQTTDGDNCVFTLDNNGNITYENHHY